MASSEDQLAAARTRMVHRHLRDRGITDERILAAFAATPRERFVPPDRIDQAYGDYPIPIGLGQTISQPYIVAEMVQQVRPQPHHRVLDVGSGSGYQTAILARLVDHVYAVERLDALRHSAEALLKELGIDNVTFSTHDGSGGWPEHAPFDGIISGAAAPDVPVSWREQLADGGRIVLPVGPAYSQDLRVIEKRGDRWIETSVCGVRFVKLIGREAWPQDNNNRP